MAYSTQTEIERLITAAKVTELAKPEGVSVVVPKVIADADAEIDLYNTASWPSAAKAACSAVLAIGGLYRRTGNGKIPSKWAEEIERWRDRLESVGLKTELEDSNLRTWHAVAFDPTLGESAAELERLYTGVPAEPIRPDWW